MALAAAGIIVVLYLASSAFGAKAAMRIPRLPVVASPFSVGQNYEEVSFFSRTDAVLLKGWFFPGTGDKVIVIIHGGYQNRVDENVDTLGLAKALVGRGYSVLLFDLRGRGESGGEGRALTGGEKDIGGAVDYLAGRGYGREDICLLGFCSGAASACIFASREDIGALVLDGCFLNVPTEVVRQAVSFGIPGFLARAFVPGLLLMTRIFYGYRVVNPIDVVGEVRCPIFFIHEELDEFTTWEETKRFSLASRNTANEIWEINGTLHSQGFRTHPEEYVVKLEAFLNKVLSD